MLEAVNYYATHCVIIIWSNWMYIAKFCEVFDKSNAWKVDPHLHVVLRNPNSLGRGGSRQTQKGTQEFYAVIRLDRPKEGTRRLR